MIDPPLQHKQNIRTAHNTTERHSDASPSLSLSKCSRTSLQSHENPFESLEKLRVRAYEQQRKNKKVYDDIMRKNPHFGYQLIQRTHINNTHAIIAQHENLLKEQAFLHNQLAKVQCITSLVQANNDPFRFLIEPWSQQVTDCSNSGDRIDRMNKNINFLKTNINEIVSKNSYHSSEISTSFILNSKEYCELKQLYQAAIGKIEAMQNERAENQSNDQQQLADLKKNTQILQAQRQELLSKLSYYEQKTKQLITQAASLSMSLMDKERQLHQVKISRIQSRQSSISERSIDNSLQGRSSLAEQDKENILADISSENRQAASTPFTSKKHRPRNRELLFTDSKARTLFKEDTQSNPDKSLRFIRRK